MRIIVAMKQLPDLVEELEVDSNGTDVDREFVKFVPNEWDEQALEEALLIKESTGAEVVVVGLDDPDMDQTLYTAIAKGADRIVKINGTGAAEAWLTTRDRAAVLANWLAHEPFDLVMTGVQSADDLDGQLAGVLAAMLGLPHASVVVRAEVKDGFVAVAQELGGGVTVEEEIRLPAVIGMQTARQTPRYAPITRVRQAMQAGGLEEVAAGVPTAGLPPGMSVRRLFPPEKSGQAEMLSGDAEAVADRIVGILRERGLIKV